MTDGNDAGDRAAADVFAKVGSSRFVRRVRLGSGKQPTDYGKDELAELLCGCTNASPRVRATKMRLLTKEIRRQHAIAELIRSLPSLQSMAVTAATWNAEAFDEQAVSFDGARRLAAQFVLEVWNAERDWKSGLFSVRRAQDTWDAEHWRAFQGWVADPW